MNERLARAIQGARKLKWPLLAATALAAMCVVAAALWVATRPLSEYARTIAVTLERSLPARKVSIEALQWRFGVTDLSVGLAAKNLRIEGAPGVQSAEWDELKVAVQPLKLLFGKLPLRLDGAGGKLALDEHPRASVQSVSAKAQAAAARSSLPELPAWLAHLRLDARLAFEEIAYGPEIQARDTRLKATLSGLPGRFEAALESELRVRRNAPELDARGPIKGKLGGFFQLEHGKPVGLRVNGLELDLDETTIIGLGVLEKSAGSKLSLRTDLQAFFGENSELTGVEVSDGQLALDQVPFSFGASWEPSGNHSFKWNAGRVEYHDLKLPLTGLREMPMEGMFETSGELKFSKSELSSGNWRVAINNMRFNPSMRPEDGAAKGKLSFSFMNEGTIENGHPYSPHAELQLDGTGAEVTVAGGKFTKPAGKALRLIAKASLKDDRLEVSELQAVFHALQVDGYGRFDGVSAYLHGRPASFEASLQSNRMDLSKYASFLPLFRKPPPLEGFLEMAGAVEGSLDPAGFKLDDLKWRIDRFNLSSLRGVMDRESFVRFGFEDKSYSFMGPFQASFLFQGRGEGGVVDRATLMTQLDLTKTAVIYKDSFRKPANVPLLLDLSAEQTRQVLLIRKGSLRFHDLDLNLEGRIVQGSARSFIDLRMPRPLRLSNWKGLLLSAGNLPLDGRIQWQGRMGFQSPGSMESNLDWRTLSVEGALDFSDVTGRFGDLRNPVRQARGKLVLAPDSVTLPSFAMEIGGAKISASGKLGFPVAKRTRRGNLSRLLSGEDWDIEAAVTANRLDPDDFAPRQPERPASAENIQPEVGPTLGQKLKAWLESPRARTSSAKLNVRAGAGSWNGLAASDINARIVWNRGLLQLQPAGMRIFEGRVSGSATWDAARYYSRRDNPELTTSLKCEGVDLAQAAGWFKPDLGKLVGGRFAGNLTTAMVGFEPEDLLRTVKGRLQGRVVDGSFDTLEALGGALDSLLHDSEAKDFLMGKAGQEACLRKRFAGDVDVQLSSAGLEIQSGGLAFETGSSIELNGKLDRNLAVALKGSFLAGPACIRGDARACLAGPDGRAAIPFLINGKADQPAVKVEVAALARKIASCAVSAVKRRAETELRKELASPQAPSALQGIEQKARDAIKGVFKR